MNKNHKISTLKNPLGWFENVILNDLTYSYRDDFYKEAKRLYSNNNLSIDRNDNSITYDYLITDDGYAHRGRYTYMNYFESIVKLEKEISIALISAMLNNCATGEKIITTNKIILNKLNYLIETLKKMRNYPIREFPVLPISLYEIVCSFQNMALYSLPNPLPAIFEEALNPPLHLFSNLIEQNDWIHTHNTPLETNKNDDQNSKTNTMYEFLCSFKWLKDSHLYSLWLYDILVSAEAIKKEETSIEVFNKAFDGNKLEKPLLIRWHLTNNHKSIKAPIIRMINYLMDDLGLIEKVTIKSQKAKMIENIFAAPDGKLILATEQTMHMLGKKISINENDLLNKLSSYKSNK